MVYCDAGEAAELFGFLMGELIGSEGIEEGLRATAAE